MHFSLEYLTWKQTRVFSSSEEMKHPIQNPSWRTMCLIFDIMNGAVQSYIGFPLMSVCCKNGTLEYNKSCAISQGKKKKHHLKILRDGTYLKKRKCTKHKGELSSITAVHL